MIWKRLYRDTSSIDGGTLHQLRNLINPKNLPKKPKHDVNSCEDFLEVITIAHVIAATNELLQAQPNVIPSQGPRSMTEHQRREALQTIALKVIEKHVNLHLVEQPRTATTDGVLEYAREVLTLSLMYAEFSDAIREGDGDRILRCWKFH